MEEYLRAIGFSNICTKKNIDNLLGEVMTTPSFQNEKIYDNGERYIEISKVYADGMGITICGYYDNKKFFHLDHYYPFMFNSRMSIKDELYFNKKMDKLAYSCVCDDSRLGVTLTFYLQNVVQYMMLSDYRKSQPMLYTINLSGLCTNGKVLLPVVKNIKKQTKNTVDGLATENSSSKVLNIKNDIYTIVENSFYPCREKHDCYSVIGTIKDIQDKINYVTKEEIYLMLVDCKGVLMKIIINKNDLVGMPTVGARFKGDIWLQGYVEFKKRDIC